jgi:Zn-dependent M28 family amino/carboxypeptidase
MRTCLVVVLGALVAGCGSSDSSSPADKVDADLYAADLATIAGARTPGTPHWQEVQDLCAARFESLGFQVERQTYATGVNVIGVRAGSGPDAQQRVVVSAHYDSVDSCDGADDNGTGVAGVLESARVLSAIDIDRTLVVACWDDEERGLIGSSAFVTREVGAGTASNYVASYVYEMIGYRSSEPNTQMTDPNLALVYPQQTKAIEDNMNRGDFILIIHDDLATDVTAPLLAKADSIDLPTITLPVDAQYKNNSLFDGLRRSDHAAFWSADIPATQITDTADYRNSHYHCQLGPDAIGDIDFDFASSVVRATVAAADKALNPSD